MNIYTVKHETWYRKEDETVWKLDQSQIYSVCTSYKKAYQTVKDWEKYRKTKFKMRLFPEETYQRNFKLDNFDYKEILEIKKWEL